VKALNKEVELLKAARESTGREFEQAETTQKELEKQLRQRDWELEDVKAMSHARFEVVNSNLLHLVSETLGHISIHNVFQLVQALYGIIIILYYILSRISFHVVVVVYCQAYVFLFGAFILSVCIYLSCCLSLVLYGE